MSFLAGLRDLSNVDEYPTAMALLFISGIGHGYATIITYVAVTMTARKRDIGFVVGLIAGFRSLVFALIRKFLGCSLIYLYASS